MNDRQLQVLQEALEGAHVAVWAGIDAADWREAEAALCAADDWLLKARALVELVIAA